MAIDLDGILIITGFFALRLAVPILVMVALCKVLPICIPYDTSATAS
jgi:hypothetical protein